MKLIRYLDRAGLIHFGSEQPDGSALRIDGDVYGEHRVTTDRAHVAKLLAPTIERMAETLDKFEEDVLRADLPGVRGKRRAIVRFGEPIAVPKEREAKDTVEKWTDEVEGRVQMLLDEINASNK